MLAEFEVWPDLRPYLAAFDELSEGRPWYIGAAGGFPGPIAQTERQAFAEMHGYDADAETLEEFLILLKALDREWLLHHAEQEKSRRKS